jgi:hypothetical protein
MNAMTEEEARKRDCPHMTRPATQGELMYCSANIDGTLMLVPTYQQRQCAASDCMAWRWLNHKGGFAHVDNEPLEITRVGLCGLAGR